MNTLMHTDYHFPGQTGVYRGKVREVYSTEEDLLIMIATDRLSAFDVVLPKGIPYKGQILNQIAIKMMDETSDLVPNWLLGSPDPNVAIGKRCNPFKVEMVIRGHLCGHAARVYKSGKRILCGEPLPEGMKENDPFPKPIITPATKAEQGLHDEDISKEEILNSGIVTEHDYSLLERYTQLLYRRGVEIAAKRGLILADTKYEFGKDNEGTIRLIDEIHTPDSSRYFYIEGFQERQLKGDPQKQLSKEFARQWLISKNFQGLEGQILPDITEEFTESVFERYRELYEQILGEKFEKADTRDINGRIEKAVLNFLQ